jgi:N,N-dimethylformamidase
MLHVIEESGANTPPELTRSLVFADIVFFETPNGGAMFTVGSMNWCGSLGHNNYENDVSTITHNVISRFSDSAPFQLPDA